MANRNDINKLFKSYYAPMYRVALTLLHDAETARDIVHDVFVSLLDKKTDRIISGGYLLTAIRNRCINHIRNSDIHRRIACSYFLSNEEYDTEEWPDEETISTIYNLIETGISAQEKRIITLRFSDGLPFSRISSIMGISETAIYRHLSHALKTIRKKLKDNG